MRFDAHAAVADEGVASVGLMVNKRLRWIFREIAKRDLGIDAQVEVCEDGRSTSRLLALQIKSSSSYFGEQTRNAIVYRGTEDHLEYFLAHSLPALLVLYDPDQEKAYWQRICEATVRRTDKGWVTHVPLAQEVVGAAHDWAEIAAPVSAEDRASLPRLKPWYKTGVDLVGLYEVLHAPRRTLDFTSACLSKEFVAILDFLASKIRVRGVIGANEPALTASAILPRNSRLELRVCGNAKGAFHQKALLVDDAALCFGSANLTWSSAHAQEEVMHCLMERDTVREHKRRFDTLWQESIALHSQA